MPKQIIIAEQHHIAAVFSEDQIQELVVATGHHQVGDIYLGTVENVLPGIDAAFVNIGDLERNGFIHVSDLGPLRLKRTSGAITELLAPQQKVLVQVMKEPTGNKGPRLSGNISLPGRYVVLMPNGRGVNLSRRIKNENERNRLRALAILIKPPGMGLLVRTEAEGKVEETIIEDLESLQRQWENILQQANTNKPPALLARDDDFIQKVLRDMYTTEVNRIVVDRMDGVKRVKQHILSWNGGKSPTGILIDHHKEKQSILEYFRVNAAIREAIKPRVDLPSGGYIIIEPTEALTVIDVNSGSFTRSATARETVLWTNCEAACEIARQLKLRNIAGVIVVDFIDMDFSRDRLQVLEHFEKYLKADKARPQIVQLSELGLVELTRKRQGQNIYEIFGKTCPTCNGLGHLVHLPGESEPAEIIPPPLELPISASRTRNEESEWEESSTFISESENLDDEQDFELLQHPSFQDRGVGLNRRRRQKNRGREVTPKEDHLKPTIRSTPTLNAIPNSLRIAPLDSPESNSSSLLSNSDPLSKNLSRPIGIGNKPILNKGEIQPPEMIKVEMTKEEQEMYALMGVSPLVKADREIKNPKSIILSINSPGEEPQDPPLPYSFVNKTKNETPVIEEEPSLDEILEDPEPELESDLIEEPTLDQTTNEIFNYESLVGDEIESGFIEEKTVPQIEPEDTFSSDGRLRRRRRSIPVE